MSDDSQRTILIADDDPDIRRMLKTHLTGKGFDVLISDDGETTLETVIVEQPDLVLLDVMMPELNGWEICKYIREHKGFDRIGVIMLTAIGETVNEMTSPLYGADAHVDKPFSFDELDARIAEVLETRAGDDSGTDEHGASD